MNSGDPFTEFDDWLIKPSKGGLPGFGAPTGVGGWPEPDQYSNEQDPRSPDQQRIAANNAGLIEDRGSWSEKVERFEAALETIGDPKSIITTRARYAIRFDGHRFGDVHRLFADKQFPCPVSFAGAIIYGSCYFDGTSFSDGGVTFEHAKFSQGLVSFKLATFGDGGVSFAHTDFGSGDVHFEETTFGDGTVKFNHATFGKGTINFRRSKFGKGDVSFYWANMESARFRFSGLHVKGKLDCTGLRTQSAVFRNTTVAGLADWTNAKFGSIPDFRQLKLDRSPEVARMEVPPPVIGTKRSVRYDWLVDHAYERPLPFKRAADAGDVLKLRKLKAMAIAASDHEKDGEFFAYEMMAKRGVEHTTFWQLLANTIYWKVSFYGQSYLRPLAWLGGTISLFGYLYGLMAILSAGFEQVRALGFGVLLSLKSALPFLGSIVRFAPAPDDHTSWFQDQLNRLESGQIPYEWFTALTVTQSLLGLFFFFFLLLGLRNRFRLK